MQPNSTPTGHSWARHLLARHVPPGVPLAYWRRITISRVLSRFVLILACVVVIGLPLAAGACYAMGHSGIRNAIFAGPWIGDWALPVALVVILAVWVPPWYAKRRLNRFVRRNRFRVCPYCAYVLAGLPDKHNCPECGNLYDLEEVRQLWVSFL